MKKIVCSFIAILMLTTIVHAETSMAEKIVTIDAGRWKTVQKEKVIRVQSLLKQLSANYKETETQIADKLVYGIQTLLRDDYGITQSLQDSMEDLNRVRFAGATKGDFPKLVIVYVELRNAGHPRNEVVMRLNTALSLNSKALDIFLKQ